MKLLQRLKRVVKPRVTVEQIHKSFLEEVNVLVVNHNMN